VVTTPATVLKNLKGLTVDGKAVAVAAPPRLFRFHKPEGLITAERDPAGRPTIYNALVNAMPAGQPAKLIYTAPHEAFFVYMKVAFISGTLLAIPVILWQLWRFVAPGLYAKEKKYMLLL